MLDDGVIERVHAPGVQRRHGELQADDERGIGEHHGDEARVDAEPREPRRAQDGHDNAGHRHLPQPEAVEQAPAQKARKGADDRARQHGHAGHGGREAEGALDVEGRDDLAAQKRRLHDDDDDGGRGVGPRLQNAHVQHGVLKAQLPPHVQRHKPNTRRDEPQGEGHVISRGEGGKPVEQRHEAHRGEHHRGHVEGGAGELAVVAQREGRERHHDHAEGGHDGEQRPPAHVVHEHAGKRGAHGRREADDEPDDAHGRAALLAGEHQQDDREHHRHDRAGAGRLHDAAEQKHPEVGGQGRRQATRREHRQRGNEQLAGGEAPHQVGRQRNDHGLHKRVHRSEPLGRGGVHPQISHNSRQRRRQHRQVQHRQKRAR